MAGLTKEQRTQRALHREALRLSGLSEDDFAALPDESRDAYLARASGEEDIDDKIDAEPEDDGLVEMYKGDETLRVHPDCIGAHKAAGWKVA